jgi:hypothetical protein
MDCSRAGCRQAALGLAAAATLSARPALSDRRPAPAHPRRLRGAIGSGSDGAGATVVQGSAFLTFLDACSDALVAATKAAYTSFLKTRPGVDAATLVVTAKCRGTALAASLRAGPAAAAGLAARPRVANATAPPAGAPPAPRPLAVAGTHATAARAPPPGGRRRLLQDPIVIEVTWSYAGTPFGSLAAVRATQECCGTTRSLSCT